MVIKRYILSFLVILSVLLLSSCSEPVGQATTYSESSTVVADSSGKFTQVISVSVTEPSLVYKEASLGVTNSQGQIVTAGTVFLQGGTVSTVNSNWRIGTLALTITANEVTPGSDGKVYVGIYSCDPTVEGWDCEWVNSEFSVVSDGTSGTTNGCGDGRRDAGAGESCDDGNLIPGDGCSAACAGEFGWQCTLDNPSKCTRVNCDYNDIYVDEKCPGQILPSQKSGPDTPVLSKFVVYKRVARSGSLSSHSFDFVFDADDNIIITGASALYGQGIYDAYPNGESLWVKKYSNNLDLLNDRYLISYGREVTRSDTHFKHQGQSVAVDNSGNSFVAGYIMKDFTPTYQTIIAKFSPTLDLIRKNIFSYGQYGAIGTDINSGVVTVTVAVDSKGNAFLAGLDKLSTTQYLFWLDKFDNNLEKIKGVNLSALPEFPNGMGQIVIDKDDKVYFISLVSMESLGHIPSLAIAKYDSDLNLIKVASSQVSAPMGWVRAVAIDDVNIYVLLDQGDIIVLSKDLQFKKRIPFSNDVYAACGLNLPPGIALSSRITKDITSDNNGHLYVLYGIPLKLINVNLNPGENAYTAASSCIQTYDTLDFSLLSTVMMDFKEIPLDSVGYQELKTKSTGFKLEYSFSGNRIGVDSQGNLFVVGDTYLVFPSSSASTLSLPENTIGQQPWVIPHYNEVNKQTFVAKFS